MRRLIFLLALAFTAVAVAEPTAHGPAKGTLLIVGGGSHTEDILKRFVELAGGPASPIVVIPTAKSEDPTDLDHCPGVQLLREAGARNLAFIHTRDPKIADSEAFVAPLITAKAVWLTGGRQGRLADAYLHTRTQRELRALLARGGVIGGTSAGASIQGSFLIRGDATDNETPASPSHLEGFGLLAASAIDQHVLARHREHDLIQVLRDRPELLGIGLDEDTGIIVHGDHCEVIGRSKALFYDAATWPPKDGNWWTELRAGARYDLRSRRVLAPSPAH